MHREIAGMARGSYFTDQDAERLGAVIHTCNPSYLGEGN
jgi:hypothetical protein